MQTREYLKKFAKPILVDRVRTTLFSLPTKLRQKPPQHYLGYVLEDKPPIVLLQGFGTTWRTISLLGDFISKLGYPVHVVDQLGHNTVDIPTSAEIVRNHIEKEHLTNVIIVAHSKGGLIGKYLLVHLNKDNRVKGLVAISCPFNGTAITKILPWKKAQELDLTSPIILHLADQVAVNSKIISISSKNDENIWSELGCYLPGALENITAASTGHSHLLFNEEGKRLVSMAIEKLTHNLKPT